MSHVTPVLKDLGNFFPGGNFARVLSAFSPRSFSRGLMRLLAAARAFD
jgi:hypothetical protein